MRRTALGISLSLLVLFGLSGLSGSARASVLSARERYSMPVPESIPALGSDLRNEECTKSFLTRLEFKNVKAFESGRDYCQAPVEDLPADARALIEKIGELNLRIAALFGQDPAETFRMGIEVFVESEVRGSIASEAEAGQVHLKTLPDWSFSDFPPMIYVHEVLHTLTFNDGPTADALVGLQEHPLLVEALPDLIASEVLDSPKIRAGEPDLPECLRTVRDGTPIRSYDEPFSSFYTLAGTESIVRCCDGLDPKGISPFTKSLCGIYSGSLPIELSKRETFVSGNRLETVAYAPEKLSSEFEAEDCRVRTSTGLVYLDNCDPHQFSPPLVSFFARLKELTGKSSVSEFFSKIRGGAETTAVYECGYSSPKVAEGYGDGKALVALRPLLGALMALRDSLSAEDRSSFDRDWTEHDFSKLIDLDRIYRNEMLGGMALSAVRARNVLFSRDQDCVNPYKLDPVDCGVSCVKRL